MDLVGIVMGLVTLPMAFLTLASVAGALVLAIHGAWYLLLGGLVAFIFGVALARAQEFLVIHIDGLAIRALDRRAVGRAYQFAAASGALPMIVILGWEYACFRLIARPQGAIPPLALWLWAYGIALGPWTLFALRVSRFRRTLCGIRAYAGHLAFWLLSILVLGLGWPPAIGLVSMALPAILPVMVGVFLALAERGALTNVRV